jgi:hypothetical protein
MCENMRAIKLDLHIHSIYSDDSSIRLDDLIKYASKKKLDGFAVCDHDSLEAYERLKPKAEQNELIAIPGMEIKTNIGEVIGLFIEEEIDTSNKDFFTIVNLIKEKNGLVVIPHPFDFLRRNHLKMSLMNKDLVEKYIDGIEVINSRILFSSCIKKAREFKKAHNLFETGGSDAHHKKEIGNGYTLVRDVEELSLQTIKQNLIAQKSKSIGGMSSPYFHFISIFNKLLKGTIPVINLDFF